MLTLPERFRRFFREAQATGYDLPAPYREVIRARAHEGELVRLDVQFDDIIEFDEELADALLDSPDDCLGLISDAIEAQLNEERRKLGLPPVKMTSNIIGIGDEAYLELSDLRAHHLGRMLKLKVKIVGIGAIEAPYHRKIYTCTNGHENTVNVGLFNQGRDPGKCQYEDCKDSKLTLDEASSTHFTSQAVYLHQWSEDVSHEPTGITGYLRDGLVGVRADPNRIITLTAIWRTKHVPKGRGGKSVTKHINYLEIVGIEEDTDNRFQITDEDRAWGRDLARTNLSIVKRLVKSLCPSIHGLEYIKLALLFQAVSGPSITFGGGRLRGPIHILLFGDPSVAKSDLLEAMTKIVPNSNFKTASGTSSPGLTFAMVEEKALGGWIAIPGVLPLSHNGLACIDEFLLLHPNDQDAFREAMERGVISGAKAGKFIEFQCNTSVLAAGNPKDGELDATASASRQLKLHPALLSRFDLTFAIRDEPDQTRDGAVVEAILKRRRGQLPANYAEADILDVNQLRTYLQVAREITVTFPEALDHKVRDMYVQARQARLEDQLPVRSRFVNTITKLAEARARLELAETVTEEHLAEAHTLFTTSEATLAHLTALCTPNIDVYDPKPIDERERLDRIFANTMKTFAGSAWTAGVEESELVQELRLKNMDEPTARETLGKWISHGKVRYRGGRYYLQ